MLALQKFRETAGRILRFLSDALDKCARGIENLGRLVSIKHSAPQDSAKTIRHALRIRRWLGWPTVVAIILFWVVLYLPHLRTSPSWYGDETYALMIGKSIFTGTPHHGPYNYTFFRPGYQPGYYSLIGAAAWLTGGDILGARFFNTLLALAIALLLAYRSRAIGGVYGALAAAFLFLSYQQSVIHFRYAFAHNFIALGILIAVLGSTYANREKANKWSAVGLLLACQAHPNALYGAVGILPMSLLRRRNLFMIYGVPLVVGVGTLLTLYFLWPADVLQDLKSTAENYFLMGQEAAPNIFQNLQSFFTQDAFHFAAVLGLCWAIVKRKWPLVFPFVIVSILLIGNRNNLLVFYYQAVVLLPLVGLSLGLLFSLLFKMARRTHFSVGYFSVVFLLGLLLMLAPFQASLSGKLIPRNYPWTTQSISDVEQTAAFINRSTTPDDLVICNGNIGWLLHCKTADWLQVTTWEGLPTVFFEDGMPRNRFLYSVDPAEAKFIVIGDIDLIWSFHQTNVEEVFQKTFRMHQQPTWISSTYSVYKK